MAYDDKNKPALGQQGAFLATTGNSPLLSGQVVVAITFITASATIPQHLV